MKNLIPAWLRVLVIFFGTFCCIEYFVDSGDRPAFVKYPIIDLILAVLLVVLIGFELLWAAASNITYQLMTEDEKQKLAEQQRRPFTESPFYRNLMKRLTKAEPVSNESELLLNHDYDGIKELDNTLPPWWVYLFYATIFFSAIYLVRFEVMSGDDQETELRKEMAQATRDVEEWKKTAPDQMDEEKVTQLTDKADLGKGKSIFDVNCAACHRADAGGQIGPNLTDDYWILGGGIKNVFHTVSNGGRDGKGMIAWNATLKPTEIQYVASYILSLRGSNPKDPKAPDGELWKEAEATADTLKAGTAVTQLQPKQ